MTQTQNMPTQPIEMGKLIDQDLRSLYPGRASMFDIVDILWVAPGKYKLEFKETHKVIEFDAPSNELDDIIYLAEGLMNSSEQKL
jgi:hypothetical protein